MRNMPELPESELAELWLADAERRDAEMESGEVAGIPGDDVFRRLHQQYDNQPR